MRTDILISFLFSTPNEIAHEVGASCNDLYFFIKQASRTLLKKKHSYRSEAQSFYEFSSKPTKIQPIKQTSASIHKIKKIKKLLSRCILTVPTMQLQYMKRIDKPTRNMSNYEKKGTDYIKIPLMVY